MPLRRIAVVAIDLPADEPNEVAAFYGWLSRNRGRVLGISDNEGCGCCVDIFNLELEDGVEEMPCESSGEFISSALKYGHEKDNIIDAALEHRLKIAEPGAAPNGGPSASISNPRATDGPPSVS
ncbi:MAG: hypothetical protein H0X66_05105 [Verrucomicrobia bacterium]|nr:hypothetical protein [Verrucomicrobiota bacterium]